MNEELETAISIITTSYLRTEDLIRSVKENLPYINEPVKANFEAFVYEAELINANITLSLIHILPEGKTEIKDPGQEHTVNPDPSVPEVTAPPAEQAPPSNEPVPGSSNGNGAVYDPVFGWVVPGNVQQSTGDSDGDLNKQVGNMG